MAPFNSMMLPLLVVASEKTGASARQALPVALIAMMAKSPMFAVVTAIALTRSAQRASSSTPGTVTGASGTTPSLGPVSVSPLVLTFGMPSFHGMTQNQAHDFADQIGIGIDGEFDERGDPIRSQDADEGIRVRRQDPEIGQPPNNNNTVSLTYRRGGFK